VEEALVAAQGGANRATFRLTSTGRFDLGRALAGDLTLLAENSPLHEWASILTPSSSTRAPINILPWIMTSGVGAQLNTTLFQQLFLTGGVRAEHATKVPGVARLPMVGVAWVPAQGFVTLKLRGAYGKGIRWPQTTVRETLGDGLRSGIDTASSLAPEEQAGVEGGMELVLAHALNFEVTRFDQSASGLIQRVAVPYDSTLPNGSVEHLTAYQPQNVGEIANTGWELQGSISHGPLLIGGTLSLVDSRVSHVANRYTGDLRAGDRMLAVPKRTMSATLSWLGRKWSSSLTAYRAQDWIYYDRLRIAVLYSQGNHSFYGGNLRNFWISYPGVTHLRATFTRELRSGFSLMLMGDNLLNQQTGEPDNIAVLPGRTIAVGLRGAF
jgi:iron complex outermembrane receptor protein